MTKSNSDRKIEPEEQAYFPPASALAYKDTPTATSALLPAISPNSIESAQTSILMPSEEPPVSCSSFDASTKGRWISGTNDSRKSPPKTLTAAQVLKSGEDDVIMAGVDDIVDAGKTTKRDHEDRNELATTQFKVEEISDSEKSRLIDAIIHGIDGTKSGVSSYSIRPKS